MYTVLTQTSAVLAMLLIMMVYPVQSMVINTAFEPAQGGIVTALSDKPESAGDSPSANMAPKA